MITLTKASKWVLAIMMSTTLVFISSCGGDDEPEPDPIVAPGLSYTPTTVAVGSTGSIVVAVTGDAATYEITDNGDAEFVTVDATTGELSVAAESTTGVYSVVVKATNSAGNSDGTAEITIGINDDFNPTGKGYSWQYYMNQDDPWTLSGLDGEVAELLDPSVDIPTGWPADWPLGNPNWSGEYLFPNLVLGMIANLLMQLPADLACAALVPEEKGNTLYFAAEEDFTLTTICTLNDAAGSSAIIGNYSISWANDQFSWALNLVSQIPITYVIDNPTIEQFIDPLDSFDDQGFPVPRTYQAIRGMVEQFTTPTNVFSETAILGSLAVKKVEVILEVTEL